MPRRWIEPGECRFSVPAGPWVNWFAWRPVKTWDRRWAWLRPIQRRLMIVKWHLEPGGGTEWWQYRRDDGYLNEGELHD